MHAVSARTWNATRSRGVVTWYGRSVPFSGFPCPSAGSRDQAIVVAFEVKPRGKTTHNPELCSRRINVKILNGFSKKVLYDCHIV